MLTKHYIKMSPADAGGAGAPVADPLTPAAPPAGDPPATPPPGTPPATPPPAAPPKIALPDNWLDSLPEELKNEPVLKNFKDVENLAKSLIHAQKQIGKDKIVKPTSNSSDAEWKAVMEALGNPADVSKYEMPPADKIKVDQGFLDSFKTELHSLGVLPRQGAKLAEWFGQKNEEARLESERNFEAFVAEKMGGLKKEWADAYDPKIAGVKHVLKDTLDEETHKNLIESGVGRNPAFLKFADAMYKKIYGETPPRDGQAGGTGYVTPAEAEIAYKDMMRDPKGPYWNPQHADHGKTKAEVQRLMKIANSTKKS